MQFYNKDLEKLFYSEFKTKPEVFSRAPGRVNLIGEHTDYNEGFVLPAALKFEIQILASPSEGDKVSLYSANFQEKDCFSLDKIRKNNEKSWSNYIRGVIKEFQYKGLNIKGFNAIICGNIPIGSGLSSSAALEVAAAFMLCKLFKFNIHKKEIALLCQRAENNFAGVNCGIMDQFISVLGEKNYALFIDCRDLSYEKVTFNPDRYSIVICDSKVSRELASSAYNKRRQECEDGTDILKKFYPHITSLRDVTQKELKEVKEKIPNPVQRRCLHVVSENERTKKAVNALKEDNLKAFGKLMTESHYSLKNDYEVSSIYLDSLVKFALEEKCCAGSRLTGAGFGGCTVSLVEREKTSDFAKKIERKYKEQTGITPDIYESQACQGGEAKNI